MSKSFSVAPNDVFNLANELINEFHPQLKEANLRLDIVFAKKETGPAVMHGGYPAAAVIKINGLKERTLGRGDAEITIDQAVWESFHDDARRALMDHELYHLVVKREDGAIMTDDNGRPVLKLRKHDFQFGWFKEIAIRHGAASGEIAQAATFYEEAGQIFFPFILELEAEKLPPPPKPKSLRRPPPPKPKTQDAQAA